VPGHTRPHTAEAKRRISLANKGRRFPPEFGAKISAAKLGVPKSAEARRNMSLAKMGHATSPETRAKLSEWMKKWWASERERRGEGK
jgi:hypothetical protein